MAPSQQFWTQSVFPQGANESYDQFGMVLAAGDFNGNGRADLSIGTPYEDYQNDTNFGKVNVLYGTLSGLNSAGSQLWEQDKLTVSNNEADDKFGTSLISGDFDGDGYDDLAIGASEEDLGSTVDSGAVNVVYGSFSGLSSTGNQFWTQQSFPSGGNESYDRFGSSLATGDFDGDGYDDLVIGTPDEDLDGKTNAGKVNVLQGSSSGLTSTGSQLWEQDNLNGSNNEAYDRFGSSLTTGDFDGDGYDDLAIGVPDEDLGSIIDSGAVHVMHGSFTGLTTTGNQFWDQQSFPSGGNENHDGFGESLASGDFDGDSYDDLAIGTPDEDINPHTNAGKVNILQGSSSGLTSTGSQLWQQDDLTGSPTESGDRFGAVLAVGDFDNDGYDDLAVGAPHEDWGSTTDAGVVNVIYGSSSGLTRTGSQLWHQDRFGVTGSIEAYDRFGSSLTVKDFNGDGFADLAIGVPGEDLGTITNSGAVHVLYGSTTGLTV